MVDQIINSINDELCKAFPGGKLYGLASTMYRTNAQNTTIQQFPAELSKDGEGNYIGLDDTFPMQLYHRLNSMTSGLIVRSGYGDNNGDYRTIANLSMFIYLNRKRTGLLPDEVFFIIQNKINFSFDFDNFKNIIVLVTAANLNEQAIFNAEYTNTELRLSPDSNLFQINYTVEMVYQKNCIQLCVCK